MQKHNGVQVVQGCYKDRQVGPRYRRKCHLLWMCSAWRGKWQKRHVKIHSSHAIKTTLRLYKDQERSQNLQQTYQADEKEGQTQKKQSKHARIDSLHPKTLNQRRNAHEESARSVSWFLKTLDTSVSFLKFLLWWYKPHILPLDIVSPSHSRHLIFWQNSMFGYNIRGMVSNADAWGTSLSPLIPLAATFSDLHITPAMAAAVTGSLEISVPALMCFSQVPLL